jgi:nitrogen fixation NifU-like protein
MYLKLDPKGETVVDVKFLVFGCGGAISSASILTEMIKGKDFIYCLSLSDDDVIEALGGLPEGKGHCSLLSVTALQAALSEHIMKSYAINEGIVKDEEEFREKFLMDRKSFEDTDDLDEKRYKKDETDSYN